jgi:hypothetical protein
VTPLQRAHYIVTAVRSASSLYLPLYINLIMQFSSTLDSNVSFSKKSFYASRPRSAAAVISLVNHYMEVNDLKGNLAMIRFAMLFCTCSAFTYLSFNRSTVHSGGTNSNEPPHITVTFYDPARLRKRGITKHIYPSSQLLVSVYSTCQIAQLFI